MARLRFAWRSLAKAPLLSLVVILSVGLGIGDYAATRGGTDRLQPTHHLRDDRGCNRNASPAGAELSLSQSGGLARASQSAGGYSRAHVLGHAVGRHWFVAGDSDYGRNQSGLR